MKRGRPIGSKGNNPWKIVGANDQNDHNKEEICSRRAHDITFHETPEKVQVPENKESDEISTSYVASELTQNDRRRYI